MYDVEQLRASATPVGDLAEFIEKNGPLPSGVPKDTSPRSLSAAAETAMVAALGPLEPSIAEFTTTILMSDGWESRTLVTRPSDSSSLSPGPLIVLFYGGGFFLGQPEQNVPFARGFARLFGATVVMPSYRLAPEHPFPRPVEDCWEALRWAASNATGDVLRADPSRGFVVGGGSAGANCAASATRRFVEEGLSPPVTGLWSSMIGCFGEDGTGVPARYKHLWFSREQNKDAMVLKADSLKVMMEWYKPDPTSPAYCPLATRDKDGVDGGFDLARMPKTFVQVGGGDLLRDDSVVLYRALEDAGVPAKLVLTQGHSHGTWFYLPHLESSQGVILETARGVGWLLGQDVNDEEVPEKLHFPGFGGQLKKK